MCTFSACRWVAISTRPDNGTTVRVVSLWHPVQYWACSCASGSSGGEETPRFARDVSLVFYAERKREDSWASHGRDPTEPTGWRVLGLAAQTQGGPLAILCGESCMSTSKTALVGSVGVVGAWRFVTSVSRTEDGNVSRQSRPGATGYIIYTDDGHMAFLNMRSTRPGFESGSQEGGTPDEKIAAFDNFVANCGTYEVEGNTVVHHVEAASVPNIVGTDLVRTFTLSGDELRVTTPLGLSPVTGTKHTTTLVFQRAKSQVT